MGAENKPQIMTRYMENGSPAMPVNEPVSDQVEKKRSSRLGTHLKRDVIDKISPNWILVRPLYARGAIMGEIRLLTGLDPKQIENTIKKNKRRPESTKVTEVFTLPDEEDRLTRAKKFYKESSHPLFIKRKSVLFAKSLFSSRLISDDISDLKQLSAIYKKCGLDIPKDFFDRLRLEVFFKASKQARKGDSALLEEYMKLGNEISPAWLKRSINSHDEHLITVISNSGLLGKKTIGDISEDEVIKLILDNTRGKEYARKLGTVWESIKSFDARGFANKQIQTITGIEYNKISKATAKNKYRAKWNRIKRFSDDKRVLARKIREEDKLPMTEDKKFSIKFAQEIFKSPFFKQELLEVSITNWIQLHAIYERLGRALPKDNFNKLRLEAFLMASKQAHDGNKALLDEYKKIGNEINPTWFKATHNSDEHLITLLVNSGAIDNGNFEKLMKEEIQRLLNKFLVREKMSAERYTHNRPTNLVSHGLPRNASHRH